MDDLDRCWAKIMPLCQEVARLVSSAPLPPGEVQVLMLYAASYLFGSACGEFEKADDHRLTRPEIASQIADKLVDLVTKTEVH